jgi:hypothetical protein
MPYLTARLIRKLESLGQLLPDERESIQAMPLKQKRVADGAVSSSVGLPVLAG